MSTSPNHPISGLIIDDDEKICTLLRDYLEPFGFHCDMAHTGSHGLQLFENGRYDLVLLDMMLPDMDGLSVLRALRQARQVPVVILSAQDEEISRILGLEMGADDYVPKAFSPRELLARLRAVLRRSRQPSPPAVVPGDCLQVQQLRMNRQTMNASLKDQPLCLTALEFQMLFEMASHPGRVYSREQLLELAGREFTSFDRSVDMHISSLRRKLGDEPHNPRYVRTVRGTGYCIAVVAERTGNTSEKE